MKIEENHILIQNSSIYYKKVSPKNATNTLVLLHDSLGCTVLWRDWLDILAQELNVSVLSYDRRGYGKSSNYTVPRPINYLEQEAEILNELIEKLELKNVHLFGFSDGASVATIYAGMFPDKIHSLTIEGVHVLIEQETLAGIRQAKHTLETTQIAKVLEKYHGSYAKKVTTTDALGNIYFIAYLPITETLPNAPFQATATAAEAFTSDFRAPIITKLDSILSHLSLHYNVRARIWY